MNQRSRNWYKGTTLIKILNEEKPYEKESSWINGTQLFAKFGNTMHMDYADEQVERELSKVFL